MTTYSGDDHAELRDCFTSLLEQKRQPDEVIIVRGYNLPSELVKVIAEFEMNAPFSVNDITIDEQGRGHARRVGVERATSKFIAIIDADDIACPNRLSRQLEYFDVNPSTDVVGGYIGEFETESADITSVREVPTELDDIKKMSYYRCPINHPTVMFRRDTVLDVGNYREIEYGEDYELWCRLLANGKKLANIPETLAKVRATDLITRRQGREIARREVQLQYAIVQSGFYGWGIAFVNLCIRIPIRLIPKQYLKRIYRKLLRS
ncbi:family 2 glycosyl transferase [Halorubrum distributum JCM 9100]|uniref:Family 2 glycosyl transferase n=3 Tax=Halorubrum distributum TaxID=29283 RepID=M0ECZ6_9EURY|nr:family 2 glycosyl transferase [Halorubrum distributum JCM 9100]ELZ53531.1 family 2 glycosyl transferase [Halorubrum distributum JCM 10118]